MVVPSFISRLYTPEVLRRLASVERAPAPREDGPAEPVRHRHLVFSGEELPGHALRARRAAWWAYLEHADAVGLLEDQDLRRRLVDVDDASFRGALAECETIWFFHHQLGLELRCHVGPDRHSDLEGPGDLHVEVKAHCLPTQVEGSAGDDADQLRRCLQEAGGQFRKSHVNVVVLVPMLRTPVRMDRDQLVKVVIGEWALSVPVSLDPAAPVAEAILVFLRHGKLAQLHGAATLHHLSRISAVVCIEEETMLGADGVGIRHVVHVVHNPFAARLLSPSMFGGHPQFVLHAGSMVWTDMPSTLYVRGG